MTWSSLRTIPQARDLARLGDGWFVNHYPLATDFSILPPATIASDLSEMLALSAPAPLYLTETGSPSAGCGAGPNHQTEFLQHLMGAAETSETRLRLVTLVWLHDLPPAEVDALAAYYNTATPCSKAYLASLGLRSWDGQDKIAFQWLRAHR